MRRIRVFINGFGRIGRSTARIILDSDDLELVGINDLYSIEQMLYLLKYDSIYEALPYDISIVDNSIKVDEHLIKVFNESQPSDLQLDDIDLVLECSGIFLTLEDTIPFIKNGAKRVVVSTPPKDNMPTYIYGVNEKSYHGEPIISNSSCSTNAIVPILSIIDRYYKVRGAQMHMLHSYTAYQNLLDSNHYSSDIRRARAAAVNIIPINSSAAKATEYFFPHLKGNLYAKSIRIPVASTTMYDLLIKIDGSTTKEHLENTITKEIKTNYQNILDITTEPKVSSDYISSSYSATIDIPLLDIAGDNLIRVSAWQDNEYGYASRLVDMARVVTSYIFEEA